MIAPDTVLQNRYRVNERVGQGGMGAVYVATDERFGSTVAIKETLFDDPTLRKAFQREAHLLNLLRHAALPKVTDHFTEGEGQFLVMEFITGDDLSELLKKRSEAFPLSQTLQWADQLLDALDYLHTQEPPIIHRDIKPQNLKLTPRGNIVLLDFGLAKGMATAQMTATGSIFGYSRSYAPLEQIQGTGTDERSDLYALAATLYHLMTGISPVDALARATEVLNKRPDPLLSANEANAQVTTAVANVLTRSMSLDAGERPQTAAAMREELRQASHAATSDVSRAGVTNAGVVPVAPPASSFETNAQRADGAQHTFAGIAPEASAPAGLHEAATLLAAENATGGAAIGSAATSGAPARDAESYVTKISDKPHQTVGAANEKSSSRRALAVGASALALVAVAAGAVTFLRNPATGVAPSASPEPQPTSSASPSVMREGVNDSTATTPVAPVAPVAPSSSPAPAQSSAPAQQTVVEQSNGRTRIRTSNRTTVEVAPGRTVITREDRPPDTPVPPPVNEDSGDWRRTQREEVQRQRQEALEEGDRARREGRRIQMMEQRRRMQERRQRRGYNYP